MKIDVRYEAGLPLLRYIVPFSFGHSGKTYDQAKQDLLASGKWHIASRSEMVPSHEEDLYDHIYKALMDDEATSFYDTNIGVDFVSSDPQQSQTSLVYEFIDTEGALKKYRFQIFDTNIFLFKTGIGLYVYEAKLPVNKNGTECENGYCNQLSLEELIVFQNRFKELNVLRGYDGAKQNAYRFYEAEDELPESTPDSAGEPANFYTLGSKISAKLNAYFADVFYFPPRINEVIRRNEINKYHAQWQTERQRFIKKQVKPTSKKFIDSKTQIDQEIARLQNMTLSDMPKLLEDYKGQEIRIVPDKAILYNYVVFNAPKGLLSAEEKSEAMANYHQALYYLTRGYKFSYKTSDDVSAERSQMFRRHENDYWDASLEGVGDYVLILENACTDDGKNKPNLFFDAVRPREMRGDYFLLYILLLYRHYSIVYYSKKISETIPMQLDFYKNHSSKQKSPYENLCELKKEINIFFSNQMYESVGQITDVCTIYSYIEEKMKIKRNISALQKGVDNIEKLQKDIIEEKQEQQTKKLNKIIGLFGILAVISIICDFLQVADWFSLNLPAFWDKLQAGTLAAGDIVHLALSLLIPLLLVILVVYAVCAFAKSYSKK